MRLACDLILHLLRVPVICGQQNGTALCQDFLHHPAHAGVNGLHGLDRCLEDAGVANHIGIGVIQDHQVVNP